ncbi:MAG: hypothetical protein ONB13_10485 [candidate division KSB1 bacterium]|nr:hypothetical protein [candidate division KSB1 bacterium]
MHTKNLFFTIAILAILFSLSFGQEPEKKVESAELVEDRVSEALLAINASQYGIKYRETQILMQNRMGLRIEYTLDRNNLQLWISPQAGKSMSYIDQNWSNRDDHTNVFDRILLPGCDLTQFVRSDWDPFHSIIYFKDQTLHLAQIYDQPAMLIWFEKDGLVDIKTFGEPVERTEKSFVINFADRGRDFQSAAILGPGNGYFQHQLQLDQYRSIHTRAHLRPGQVLLIASELQAEQIGHQAKEWVRQPIEEILARNERLIAQDLSTGQFKLKDRPEMQKLLDKSRRVALSMQAFKGFMRSTNQYIYYLLWYRDGGMNTAHLTYSGWPQPAFDHTKFALLNPNFTNEHPDSIFFAQIMAGPITKWEEDGLFYVVWPAFSYWTQTGDRSLCQGQYLETMERAMRWLEDYCYDEQQGLFGRYFSGETPLTNSRDDGWDNATGAPTFKWKSEYQGKTIVRSYDLYINLLCYSTYLMLSSMHSDPVKADVYYQKAVNLEKQMKGLFDTEDTLPSYGRLLTESGDSITAAPYGMELWDYVWGLSLPPFEPNWPQRYRDLREQIRKDMTTTSDGYFLCVYFAMLTAMDPAVHHEDELMAAMDKLVEYSSRPGKYLPMPYAMPEMFNISEENPFHDVRPLVYSIAPWLSAVTNLGLHRLPFGIAARGTKYLEKLDNYAYKGALLNVSFKGQGKVARLMLNGEPIIATLQIPENKLKKGANALVIEMAPDAHPKNRLVASTVQLRSATGGSKPNFEVTAYGKNVLTFENLTKKITIIGTDGQPKRFEQTKMDNFDCIEFFGRGEFKVVLE